MEQPGGIPHWDYLQPSSKPYKSHKKGFAGTLIKQTNGSGSLKKWFGRSKKRFNQYFWAQSTWQSHSGVIFEASAMGQLDFKKHWIIIIGGCIHWYSIDDSWNQISLTITHFFSKLPSKEMIQCWYTAHRYPQIPKRTCILYTGQTYFIYQGIPCTIQHLLLILRIFFLSLLRLDFFHCSRYFVCWVLESLVMSLFEGIDLNSFGWYINFVQASCHLAFVPTT